MPSSICPYSSSNALAAMTRGEWLVGAVGDAAQLLDQVGQGHLRGVDVWREEPVERRRIDAVSVEVAFDEGE